MLKNILCASFLLYVAEIITYFSKKGLYIIQKAIETQKYTATFKNIIKVSNPLR